MSLGYIVVSGAIGPVVGGEKIQLASVGCLQASPGEGKVDKGEKENHYKAEAEAARVCKEGGESCEQTRSDEIQLGPQ